MGGTAHGGAQAPADEHEHGLVAPRTRAFHELVEQEFAALVALSDDELDAGIVRMLGSVATFLGADRGYIIDYDLDARLTHMTHEWCAEGVPGAQATEQERSFDDHPGEQARILNLQINEVRDTRHVPADWAVDAAYFEEEGITAILEVPFLLGGRVQGLVGFDQVSGTARWQPEDLPLLRSVAALTEQALTRRITGEAVRAAVAQGVAAFEHSPLGIVVMNADGLVVEANQSAGMILGVPPEHLLGTLGALHVHSDDRPALLQLWADLVSRRAADAGTFDLRTPEVAGSRWMRCDLVCVRAPDGSVGHVTANLTDIEAARATDAALLLSEHRFASLIESLPEAVIVLDGDGRIATANPAALRSRDQMLATGIDALDGWPALPATTTAEFDRASMRARVTGRPAPYRLQHTFPDGTEMWLEGTVVPDPGAATGGGSTIVYRDVTDQQLHARQLEHQATHDGLTGLPNRTAFVRRLEEACGAVGDGRSAVALLFLDIDNFKQVNDSLGHEAGDRLLKEMAARIRGRLRADDVLARFGGDEFTVLLSDTDADAAVAVAESVCATIALPLDDELRRFAVTTSIGVVVVEAPGSNPSHLLRWADVALYRAKEQGRNQVVLFDEELQVSVADRIETSLGLREAVGQGRIEVHYQPEVDLRTGLVRGVEALARWRHPQRGLLAAGDFIATAEADGTIVPIGWHVLGEACETVAGWRRRNLVDRDFVLRVNLSAQQLDQRFMANRLAALLEQTGLPASHLCLEITETTLMQDAEEGLAALDRLRGTGVRLAIDDFGTGYSSLHLLKRLPIDVVKVDRSFIAGLPHDEEDRAIVATILGLVDLLGLSATAEGVERPEQGDALLELGCSYAQGYLFSRPVPAEEVVGLLGGADLREQGADAD